MRFIHFQTLVFIQVLILIIYLPVYELLKQMGYDMDNSNVRMAYILVSYVYGLLLFGMVKLHVVDKRKVQATLYTLLFLVILSFLSENPYFDIGPVRGSIRAFVHIALLFFEVAVISFAIKDLLSESKTLAQKIWAAIATYLLINFSWGGFYDLINILLPGSLGPNLELGFSSYMAGITYSFSVIGGGDRLYDASRFITELSKIQSLWCSMYMIFLLTQFRSHFKKEEPAA